MTRQLRPVVLLLPGSVSLDFELCIVDQGGTREPGRTKDPDAQNVGAEAPIVHRLGLECYSTAIAGSKIGMTRKIVALSSFLGPWAVAAFSVLSGGEEMK